MEEENLLLEPLDAILIYAENAKEQIQKDPKNERKYIVEASERLGLVQEDIEFFKEIVEGKLLNKVMNQEEKAKMRHMIETVTDFMEQRRG